MPFDHAVSVPPPEAAPRLADTAFAAHLLAGMPADLAARFDARLIFAVQQAVAPWDGAEGRRGWHVRLALPGGTWRFSLVPEAARGRRRELSCGALAALGWFSAGMAIAAGLAVLV